MLDRGLCPATPVLQVLLNQPLCSRWTSASLAAFPQMKSECCPLVTMPLSVVVAQNFIIHIYLHLCFPTQNNSIF